jgi:formamidopyrimidine-DNA glycosylase
LLRSVDPPLADVHGRTLTGVTRLGKRLVLAFAPDRFLVVHLMIAGRLQWRPPGAPPPIPARIGLAALDFTRGTVLLTEAGTRRRATLHLVRGAAALALHDRGGLEPLTCTADAFAAVLRRERHTLKRALTDPTILAGIGNAYSDEILHAARLSPLALTTALTTDELARLHAATQHTLEEWITRLRAAAGDAWPTRVTAFREGMAVHGRYRRPCPVCGAPIQRIRYAANEVNYCAACQTGGRVLADRALSRLLREDWPRELDAWEERVGGRRP